MKLRPDTAALLRLSSLCIGTLDPEQVHRELGMVLADALPGAELWIHDTAQGRLTNVTSGATLPWDVATGAGPRPPMPVDGLPLLGIDGGLLGVVGLTAPASGAAVTSIAQVLTARLRDVDAVIALRARTNQLAALNAAANQLSAQLELDQVLATVCSRARALTGAEIAYIMLIDPVRGDCSIRASEGVQTEVFRAVRLDIGQGLGGLVAEQGRPYYSSDYATDPRFGHVVDDAVAGEGVVSVLGVPMLVDGVVTGILFAAYRRRTTFSEADSDFLVSLGEHAAIALANARLHGQTEEALTRERALHQLAEQQRAKLEIAARVHDSLSELMLDDLQFDELLDEVGTVLGCSVVLSSAPAGAVSASVGAGRERLGWLCADGEQTELPERSAVEQAARVVAAHLLRERAVLHAEFRSRSELLEEILDTIGPPSAELVRRAQHFGISLDGPLAVACVMASCSAAELGDAVSQAHARLAEPCLVLVRAEAVIVVTAARRPREWGERLTRAMAGTVGLLVGIAGEAAEPGSLDGAVEEAQGAVDAARAIGRPDGAVVTQADLGIYPLLLHNGSAVRAYADRLLRPLIAYDQQHGSELLATLEVHLRHGGRRAAVAQTLNVHPNTLSYRLRRIREIAGVDPYDADAQFELNLALRVHRAYGARSS